METLNSNRIINLHRFRASETRSSCRSTYRRSAAAVVVDVLAFKNKRSAGVLSSSLAWSNIYKTRKNYIGAVFEVQGNNKSVQASAANTGPSGKPWCNWLVGVILSIVLPFASRKWSRILAIKNEIDTVVETVETVVETVETVAKEVAHVAEEMAHQLPEGGKLQNIVCSVANVAEETAKDAHLIDQLIEKV
ncbi:uncharacterized protein [Spinacia oleracea]|nr:uncharacterized protein LOC110795761 isoform X2 [Spinacia oleracea]